VREERTLRVCENKVLRIFGLTREEVTGNCIMISAVILTLQQVPGVHKLADDLKGV
jgi:hypothetical protein